MPAARRAASTPTPKAPAPHAEAAASPIPDDTLELHAEPGHLMRRAHQIAVSTFHETHGRHVTPVQYAILRALQDNPGNFFTVVQIGLNAVAILGGIVGEQALSPHVAAAIGLVYDGPRLHTLSFVVSFVFAMLAVRALLKFIASHSYAVFAWYRIGFGLLILASWVFGVVDWSTAQA